MNSAIQVRGSSKRPREFWGDESASWRMKVSSTFDQEGCGDLVQVGEMMETLLTLTSSSFLVTVSSLPIPEAAGKTDSITFAGREPAVEKKKKKDQEGMRRWWCVERVCLWW